MHPARIQIAVFVVVSLSTVACSRSPEPASHAQPAGAAPGAGIRQHMADHFARVREIEEAVIRGDLDAARPPARWIADHQEASGLPPAAAPYVDDMKVAARAVVEATGIEAAAAGAATLVASCGDCHAASKVTPRMPAPASAAGAVGRTAHMAEHQRAVDLLYRGLTTPSDAEWRKGADALRTAPLGGSQLPDVSKEDVAAESAVHALAERAIEAQDRRARVGAYGDIISRCASCHGLHGRVWGPGLPKGE